MNSYYSGDTIEIEAILSLNALPDPDIATTTIQCAIVKGDKKTIAIGPNSVVVVDLVTGTVGATFTSTQTTALPAGKYYVEFQGTRTGGNVITWGQSQIQILANAIPPV